MNTHRHTAKIEHLARTLAAMPFSLAWSWAGYLFWTAGDRF
jgi:hypothetical protein